MEAGGPDRRTARRLVRRGRRRIWFDPAVRATHERAKRRLGAYLLGGDIGTLLTAPVIYSLLLPLVVLDVWVTVYQWLCFPVYGIARVPRRRYFVLDRHKLAYLNGLEKLNCTFCSYANGVVAYVREVAARTEQYWCPIKHGRRLPAPHARYDGFAEYGDPADYRSLQDRLRRALPKP